MFTLSSKLSISLYIGAGSITTPEFAAASETTSLQTDHSSGREGVCMCGIILLTGQSRNIMITDMVQLLQSKTFTCPNNYPNILRCGSISLDEQLGYFHHWEGTSNS